jgi:hypothetical protein
VTNSVPVYDWVLDGVTFGCGTKLEFDYWNNEGVNPKELQLGGIITYENPAEDQKRLKLWGIA